ncbi:MAG: MotA/TolQ/ExbB proton channel family protein [Gammaproteobacteria bacterium]|nr:MotA/TolQ/ExbB proton channel family protein [Gammaproteobacteria bacterium]
MQPPTDSNLVFRALIIVGLIAFGVYLAADRGLLMLALSSDRSYISYVIFGIYLLASGHWLWLTYTLGRERTRFTTLETELKCNERAPSTNDTSLLGRFIANWRTKGEGSDPAALLTAFGDELTNRHALGHFTSDALLKLGLLGTVVGFILMLLPVGEIEEFDPSIVQQLLSAMSGGMAVALYTTLAGLITSTLLKLQYHILDASAADLATRLSVLTELHITRDAS